MAFHDPIDAISWALDVQHKLLLLPWPPMLLSHADAKEQYSPGFLPKQVLLFKGLRVRMAMHTGKPDAIQVSPICTQPKNNVQIVTCIVYIDQRRPSSVRERTCQRAQDRESMRARPCYFIMFKN